MIQAERVRTIEFSPRGAAGDDRERNRNRVRAMSAQEPLARRSALASRLQVCNSQRRANLSHTEHAPCPQPFSSCAPPLLIHRGAPPSTHGTSANICRAWRFWSLGDPAIHQAVCEFADQVSLDRAMQGDDLERLVADFNRDWPEVTRTREMLVLAQAFDAPSTP